MINATCFFHKIQSHYYSLCPTYQNMPKAGPIQKPGKNLSVILIQSPNLSQCKLLHAQKSHVTTLLRLWYYGRRFNLMQKIADHFEESLCKAFAWTFFPLSPKVYELRPWKSSENTHGAFTKSCNLEVDTDFIAAMKNRSEGLHRQSFLNASMLEALSAEITRYSCKPSTAEDILYLHGYRLR